VSRAAVLLGLSLSLAACGGDEGKKPPRVADPRAFDLGDVDAGFRLEVPKAAPAGEPVTLPRVPAAGTYRTRGTFRSVQAPTGTFGPETKRPRRAVWGTVEATTTVPAKGPAPVEVEGRLRLQEAVDDAPARERSERFTLSFDPAGGGGAEPRTVLFRPPADLRDLLGTVTALWTDPVPLPDRPVRPGDVFEPTVAIDVDPWRRTMWEIFQKGNPERPPVVVAVEGGAWVAAREKHAGDDVLVVRTAFNHAHAQEAGPFGKGAVKVGYAAAERSTRRVATRDGLCLAHDLAVRRRLRAQGAGFDYVVDTLEHAVLSTERAP
jgi:hypothetical protein